MHTNVRVYRLVYPKGDIDPYSPNPEKVRPWDTVTSNHGVKDGHGGKVNIYNFRTSITITIDSRR